MKKHGYEIWLIGMGMAATAIVVCGIVLVAKFNQYIRALDESIAAYSTQETSIEEEYPIHIVESEEVVKEAETAETSVVTPVEATSGTRVAVLSNVDIPLDTELQQHIRVLGAEYGVDPNLIFAVIRKESTYNTGAVGDSGRSLGLMQIQPRWHAERMSRLGVTDLLDPYQNVKVGVDYIADLMATGKPIEWVLMAYNGGPSYANSMWAAGEVSGYADTVLRYSKEVAVG